MQDNLRGSNSPNTRGLTKFASMWQARTSETKIAANPICPKSAVYSVPITILGRFGYHVAHTFFRFWWRGAETL